ncbi:MULTISPECIES: replication initiator [Streptomyces]|uniref:Plasmid replication initiator protein n=1 Tax=Streptomyces evansiae TaxID=3075535 RepID=A0ABU2QZH1_9ACTN|nr:MULTISPECIES: replication initiator [unclassified Streptomyces]MDT0409857.1 plasmid replication initiator protein [Streptomyces sp. DSM 41979]MYQ60083.1 plasmid replication initiator protein [Streptomyces sp. SID4926]SCD98211.1 hypothetical protein GA0115252_12623 [Streptomyces sp. DfronAA-171]
MAYPSDERRPVSHEAGRLSLTERDLIRIVHDPGFPRWLEQMKSIGGCAHPIYLSGHTTTRDAATGEILTHYDTREEPGERLAVRCRNRRETRCPPCSRLHSGDTYHLVRSGLLGGKGIGPQVRHHPRVFVTLTAPSWGPVHRLSAPGGPACRPRRGAPTCDHGRPLGCPRHHEEKDPQLGQPLCPGCYDYTGHVLWNADAGLLWTRFCHTLRREIASAAGIVQSRIGEHLRLSFAKVAEYQLRGAIHFHAVIRIDGPDGPSSAPPLWATPEMLTASVRTAAGRVAVRTPYSPATGEREMRWGEQIDVHSIRSDAFTGTVITDSAVAAYVAKYVAKSVGDSGGVDSRMESADEIRFAPVNPHVRTIMMQCWRLGGLTDLESLNLRSWAHTLGFRGHVLTKSRAYSTTYGALRQVRENYLTGPRPAEKGRRTETESAWRYVGAGHSLAQAEIARGIAEDLAERKRLGREVQGDGLGEL